MNTTDIVTVVTITCALVLISLLVIRAACRNQTEEPFEGRPKLLDTVTMVNDVKSLLYNINGLYYFYSSGDFDSIYFKQRSNFADFVSYLVYFYPTITDEYCKAFDYQQTDPIRCNNIYIDYVTTPDDNFTAISSRETTCRSLASSMKSSDATASDVRIMNSNYAFCKRCLRLNITNVQAIAGGQSALFEVTVRGYVNAFVLSRPIFISFGHYGLYTIVHNHPGTCFTNFTSSSQENKFVIKAVTSYQDAVMYPHSGTNILTPTTAELSTIPIIVYYLKYKQDLPLHALPKGNIEASDQCNVLSLVLSSQYLSARGQPFSCTLPTTAVTAAKTLTIASKLQLDYSPNTLTPNDIFVVKVFFGTVNAGSSEVVVRPHPQFMERLIHCRSTNTDHRFHVVLTYSVDVMHLVCFLEIDGHRQDYIFATRQSIHIGPNYVTLSYFASQMREAMSQPGLQLDVEMKRYQELLSMQSIPNFAVLGKLLGYEI